MSGFAHTMVSKNTITVEAWNVLTSAMPYRQWEVPILVLISVTFQVVLVFLSNWRRYSGSRLLDAVLWSAYNVANAVATLALGIISTNLTVNEILDSIIEPLEPQIISHKSTLSLDPRIELQTFWAPFFLLHLGGPDTITAFGMEDNELWKRHLLSLVGQTSLTVFILFEARTRSSLTALSAMIFAAGSIKYAERTWSLWSASYNKRRRKAEKDLSKGTYDGRYHVDLKDLMRQDDVDGDVKLAMTSTVMFLDTEGMFANAFMYRELKNTRIVEKQSSTDVMRLIEMELKMMYDNLYTKARVILSSTGLILRFISFLLTCITLVMFSLSKRRKHFQIASAEYSCTFILFAVSIGLELYAAFIFLNLYRTIPWFREHKMDYVARILENLPKLTTQNWSNSMGQFSLINYYMQNKPKGTLLVPWSSIMWRYVYHRPVPVGLKKFIHNYLMKASMSPDEYLKMRRLYYVQSKGIVPWNHYYSEHAGINSDILKFASSLFDKEFGEMIVFLHIVTEVCYYLDRPIFAEKVRLNDSKYKEIHQTSRFSKYLSRYLMHLFAVSSDLLPQRTPLSKRKFRGNINPSWRPFFSLHQGNKAQVVGGEEQHDPKLRACKKFWKDSDFIGAANDISDLRFAQNLLNAMRPDGDDVSPDQLRRRWKLLSEMWVELVVHATDQCKGTAHAEHLRQGGELLTHVWVLLGHFGFIDEALLPYKDHDDDTETGQLSSAV